MHHEFPRALRDLHLWDGLSLSECEEIARFVAAFLPHAFHFVRVEAYQAGTQRHTTALFEWRGHSQQLPCYFVLIPGGTVTLGHDQTLRFVPPPSEELLREWQDYNLDYEERLSTI